MKNPIIDEFKRPAHPIRPRYIDTRHHFYNAFNHMESEAAARTIVKLLQDRGDGWLAFRLELPPGFHFGWLLAQGWVVKRDDGAYCVTHAFICRCFESSPVFAGALAQ